MIYDFKPTLKEYARELEAIEVRLNFWLGFYKTNSQMLKNVLSHSDDYLKYFETTDGDNIIEFGAVLKTVPVRCFIEVEGIESIEDKIPARLYIRQDIRGNIQFRAVSPYFKERDGFKKVCNLIEPVSPKAFDYNELPNILIKFLGFVNDWESTADNKYVPLTDADHRIN